MWQGPGAVESTSKSLKVFQCALFDVTLKTCAFQEACNALSLESAYEALDRADLDEVVRLLKHKSDIQTRILQLMETRRKEEDGYAVYSDNACALIDLYESSTEERRLLLKIHDLQMKERAKAKEQLESLMRKNVMCENAISMIKAVRDLSKCTEVRKCVMSPDLMEIRSSANKKLFWELLVEIMRLWDDKLRGNVNDSDEVHEYISVRLCAFDLDLNLDVMEEIFSFLCKQIPSNEAIDEKVKAGIMTRFDSFFFWAFV